MLHDTRQLTVAIATLLLLFFCTACQSETLPEDTSTATYSTERCTFELGIHRSVLFNDKRLPSEYEPLIDQIKEAGARTLRLSVKGGKENEAKDHILYANKKDLNVTLLISTAVLPLECYEEGTTLSPGNEKWKFWQVYPISRIVPEKYNSWIRDLLQSYKDAGCEIDVIEVGNEIMWAAFNADLPIEGGIVYDSSYKWEEIPESIRTGILRSGEIALLTKQAAKEIMADNTPEVIFGSLNISENLDYYKNSGGCIVRPETVIEIAMGKYEGMGEERVDYISQLDGYGIHLYPDKCSHSVIYQNMIDASLKYLHKMMDPIAELTSKPAHVTEFGFIYKTYGISSDWKRCEQFQAFLEAMDMTSGLFNWRQAHIYSWDQGDHAMVNIEDGTVMYTGQNVIHNYYEQQ